MLDAYSLILISSLLMGIATIVEKNSLKIEHATAFSTTLSFIVAILSLLLIPFANFNITPLELLFLFIQGVVGAYTYLLSARVFKHSQLSVSSAGFSTIPMLFVVLFAFLFLSEQLTTTQYVSIVGMFIATYMLFFQDNRKGSDKPFETKKYEYMIFINAIIGALTNILAKYTLSNVNPYTFLILVNIFIAINFAIYITVKYRGLREVAEMLRNYRMPIITNSILTLGYRSTYIVALAATQVSIAQPLRNTIYVIITIVVGGYIFKEKGLKRKFVLSIIMLLFAYLLTLNT